MILVPIVIGFEVPTFDPDDQVITLLYKRISEERPKLSTLVKRDIGYATWNNYNMLVIITVTCLFESEVISKAIRTDKIKQFREFIVNEFQEYFKSKGILYNLIAVD